MANPAGRGGKLGENGVMLDTHLWVEIRNGKGRTIRFLRGQQEGGV